MKCVWVVAAVLSAAISWAAGTPSARKPAGPPRAPAPVGVALERPKAGKVDILRSSELRPGMKGVAWTVFEGSEPEPIPVEIIGLWKNAWGPKQDIILAKMGGRAQRTNVAGGMSGSPVYVDGKLIGAVALRLSIFSPDAICGITPIELMLEINDYDDTKPADARTPDRLPARAGTGPVPGELLARVISAAHAAEVSAGPVMVPIETPLTFSGFHESVLRQFGGLFRQLGITAVQGGASGSLRGSKPAPGWQNALRPGDAVAGVLVSGDMTVTGLGTVTYNDGKRVLAFGHPFFNLGPVSMPMSKGEVLMVLSSAFQPNKFANATEIVGALKQDRHSGILGELGAVAEMIPVSVNVRSFSDSNRLIKDRKLNFHVFVQQKWTPYLMMLTLFNSVAGMNDFADEATYRLSARVELEGHESLSLNTMLASGDMPTPASMLLAGWWGDKFNRLFGNAVKTPRLKSVSATVDLLPQRRVATLESAWISSNEVEPGAEVPVRVYLRPYRGDRFMQEVKVKIPAGFPKGEHRIVICDADTLNRTQGFAAQVNRFMDLPATVSLLNQERSNNRLYVALAQNRPTFYEDDKTLPSLPASILNVIQSGRAASRPLISSAESILEQSSVALDYVVTGSQSLRITVR